jgi:hypothetical protein
MKKMLKKLLSLVLVAALFTGIMPPRVLAVQEKEIYLPETKLGEDILQHDVFYLGTTSANISESGHGVYLLRVGRGGPADTEATALIKIADLTAKYGTDYVVRVRNEATEAESPEDNLSLMEMIEGSDFEQTNISEEEAFNNMLENSSEAQAAYQEGVNAAVEFLEEASGLDEKYGGEDPYAEPAAEMYASNTDLEDDAGWDEGAIPADDEGEVITIGEEEVENEEELDPIQRAMNAFTGVDAKPQRLTSDGDTLQDLQAIANVMTNVVVGAKVELSFAPGERVKYLEIVPKNNRVGDGDRMFYVILGAPRGTTTNSSASSCAFTIVDDEGQEPASVSFSAAEYTHVPGAETVKVTVERTGAMNTVVSARVKTTSQGVAQPGRDYSEVDTELVFPFGVSHLDIDIPVRTEYLTGEGSFALEIIPTAGCEAGEISAATVKLAGTYTDKASLLTAQSAKLMLEKNAVMVSGAGSPTLVTMGQTTTDRNNLSTYKTLDALDVKKPYKHGTVGSNFSGYDYFNSSGFYHTMWKGKKTGTVGVIYELTPDYWTSFYLAGAEVTWWRSYGCSDRAWMKLAIAGKKPYEGSSTQYPFDYYKDASNQNGNFWYPFDSGANFDYETRYVYPHENAIDPAKQTGGLKVGGDHPQAIELLNIAFCDDCSQLWIWGIKPIQRPIQVNIKPADSLNYLKGDGTRGTDTTSSTTNATMSEAGSQAVFFMDDSFTVVTSAGSNVTQYGYLSKLQLLDGKTETRPIATLAENKDSSNTSITYKLSPENMEKLIKEICPNYKNGDTTEWFELLRKNDFAKMPDGYATYAEYNIKPVLDYVKATVTLRNPYDFPVTITISGTDYALNAKETKIIKAPDGQDFHMGDTLKVSAIKLGQATGELYTAAGVSYRGKFSAADSKDKTGTWTFDNGNPVYISGTGDNRLNFSEITIEPVLQDKNNKIIVRVKTDELDRFITSDKTDGSGTTVAAAGLLGQTGVVEGEYTYFTYADTDKTVSGKLYAITVTPANSQTVATWYDANSMRTYVGNTLYFTAGDKTERNIITLSAEDKNGSVTLQGTLKYMNYNLRTGYSGNESNVPARGAALAAGSAGGVANSEGFVSAGPIPITGKPDRYLRYMVSINGTDLVKELLLPEDKTITAEPKKPTVLWDFNADGAVNFIFEQQIDYTPEKDSEENEYYTFSGRTAGACIELKVDQSSVENIQWVKVRAKNVSGEGVMAFFNKNNIFSMSQMNLEQDNDWHEYVFNLTDANKAAMKSSKHYWANSVPSILLYPFWKYNNNGDNGVQIDYVAYFPTEADARAYARDSLGNAVIDISSNFPNGVSPVSSDIFNDIQIEGTISDSAYQIQDNTYIPVVVGKTANMKVRVKPQEYSYSMTGEGGKLEERTKIELPRSVQLVVYTANDVLRGVYDVVDEIRINNGYYEFNVPMEMVAPGEEEIEREDFNGNKVKETIYYAGLVPEPGDKLYLRLVTDRLAQTEKMRGKTDKVIDEYRYSDIFTGMTFYQPVSYQMPPEMGIKDPIQIEYGNLPLIGNTGMDLDFPFVSVGIMKISHGYRLYIGFSPVQIADTVKDSHMSSTSGSDGQYWKDLFSIKHPFDTFAGGLGEASKQISEFKESAKEAASKGEKMDTASMGSPSWKFDISIGIYFDFINPTITQNGITHTDYIFNGMGGYVSVTLGFSMSWYFVLPVVFLPAYIGIDIQGTVMGFLGADFNKDVKITYDDSLNGTANINDGIDRLNGGIRGSGFVQLSLGVGLCGTLGVRVSGKVDFIANWEPRDPHGSWGFYVGISAGLIIDLFLFSIPLMYNFAGWPFGSFEYYSEPEKWTEYNPAQKMQTSGVLSEQGAKPLFVLREDNGEESVWRGSDLELMGAFAPNEHKEKILVDGAYERPDAQLITLSDGESLALAFLDKDDLKGDAQRTTLKVATYYNGAWSEPVVVSNDETADFHPSIAEMKDGRLLVAWVSTVNAYPLNDWSNETVRNYLCDMEVYAAFLTLDGNKQISSRKEHKATSPNAPEITVADTAVTRISNDIAYPVYDSNPTVVCDMDSGDAAVFYIKSGIPEIKEGNSIENFVNPYTNGSVVTYMLYNAEADSGVHAGWLTDIYYSDESNIDNPPTELINDFGAQRYVAPPTFVEENKTFNYSIPDFTAIGYGGKAVYAYSVDTDGSSDTDSDREIYLQVYDFAAHKALYQLRITDDEAADTMPQLFRSKVNNGENVNLSTNTDLENTHTKLFWYKDGKEVVYIDVTELLLHGIDNEGNLKNTTDSGENGNRYIEPRHVFSYNEKQNDSAQNADFRAVEDSKGNLYVLWTEGVSYYDSPAAREIFATGLVTYEAEGGEVTSGAASESSESFTWSKVETEATSGWTKPYQLTAGGYINDELAVAMSGDDLVVVHNRFMETLNIPETEYPETVEVESAGSTVTRQADYNGQVDFMPIITSDMKLVSEVLEPCGSVEATDISLYSVSEAGENGEIYTPVTLPLGGEKVAVMVTIENNGLNIAQGHRIKLSAIVPNGVAQNGDMAYDYPEIDEIEVTEPLIPGNSVTYFFDYTLPANVDGVGFLAETQEMYDAQTRQYYASSHVYPSSPLKAKAAYEIKDVKTYQDSAGFRAAFSVTNTGNAASGAGDTLSVTLKGPANLEEIYGEDGSELYSGKISLAIGETKEFDIPVSITPAMIGEFGFVTALITVQEEVVESSIELENGSVKEYKATHNLSNMEYADFDLVAPMNMALQNVNVAVNQRADILFTMELDDKFLDGEAVSYAVDDLSIARVEGGRLVGVSAGETTLYATHSATGATVSSTVKVTRTSYSGGSSDSSAGTPIVAKVSGDEGSVTVSAVIKDNTATVTAPTETQMQEITGTAKETGSVTIDLSSLPDKVTAVTIPAETVKAIDEAISSGGEGLTIELPNSSVTFDAEALSSITEQTGGKDVTLVVEPIAETKLNTAQQAAVADMDVQTVYDVYLVSEDERISSFGGGSAAVKVKHNLAADKQPGGLEAWYVADSGEKQKMPATADATHVTIIVPHFSNYVLAYNEELPGACDRGTDCPLNAFTDLDKTAWYHDGVHWALEKNVMNGVGEGKFAPNGTTSRAMIVTMLHRMEGEPKADGGASFTDVEPGAWYTEAIKWAAANEIVTGYGDGKFGPNDTLTREQLATILYRYAKLKGQGFKGMWAFRLAYSDAAEVSEWAYEAMCWMTMNGVIQGTGKDKLSPKQSATRAQVATMLMRYDALEK